MGAEIALVSGSGRKRPTFLSQGDKDSMNKKHALIMVACCLIPIVAFTLISVFKVPVSGMITIGLILLCPISHLLMMKFMMPGHEGHKDEDQPRLGDDKALNQPAAHQGH